MYCYLALLFVVAYASALPFHDYENHGEMVAPTADGPYVEGTKLPYTENIGEEKSKHFHASGKGFVLNLNFAGGSGEAVKSKSIDEEKELVKSAITKYFNSFKITKIFEMEEHEIKNMVEKLFAGFKKHIVDTVLEEVKKMLAIEKEEVKKKIESGEEKVKAMLGVEKAEIKKLIEEAKKEVKKVLAQKP